MKPVKILAVGEKMPDWVDSACNNYLSRFAPPLTVELHTLKAEKRQRNGDIEEFKQREWERIQSAIPAGAMTVLLDESGRQLDTVAFKNKLVFWRETCPQLVLVIGGADGFPFHARDDAAYCLSLSSMTLPHSLARVVLIEQLYRVFTLMTGHPYHRT